MANMRNVCAQGGRARGGSGGPEREESAPLLCCVGARRRHCRRRGAFAACRLRRRRRCDESQRTNRKLRSKELSVLHTALRPTNSSFVGKQEGSLSLSLRKCVLSGSRFTSSPPFSSPSEGEAAPFFLLSAPVARSAPRRVHTRHAEAVVMLLSAAGALVSTCPQAARALSNGQRRGPPPVLLRSRPLSPGLVSCAAEALTEDQTHVRDCIRRSHAVAAALEEREKPAADQGAVWPGVGGVGATATLLKKPAAPCPSHGSPSLFPTHHSRPTGDTRLIESQNHGELRRPGAGIRV